MNRLVYIILSFCLLAALLCGCAEQAAPAGETEAQSTEQADEAVLSDAEEESEPEVTTDPNAGDKYEIQVSAMDTMMILTAYGSNAEAALDEAEQLIYDLEADLDPETEGGSIYAANAGAGLPVVISRDAMSILETALFYYEDTGGAIDPGLYPIINAWGFTTKDYRVPSRDELDTLLAQKDTAGIVTDEVNCTVTLPADTQISLGSVAKGYTAQCVVDLLAERGVTSAVLSLGGNVQTLGDEKPNGSQWQVAIMNPHDTGSYVGILSLGQKAVVTSGGYQRYFEQDGVTYIHIIDPSDGVPVSNDLLSVTVVTDDGTVADALSTATFVMGKQGALDYYEQHSDYIDLVLITTDDEVIVTPGLVDCFTESDSSYTFTYLN